jgi:hypothetical protein
MRHLVSLSFGRTLCSTAATFEPSRPVFKYPHTTLSPTPIELLRPIFHDLSFSVLCIFPRYLTPSTHI